MLAGQDIERSSVGIPHVCLLQVRADHLDPSVLQYELVSWNAFVSAMQGVCLRRQSLFCCPFTMSLQQACLNVSGK